MERNYKNILLSWRHLCCVNSTSASHHLREEGREYKELCVLRYLNVEYNNSIDGLPN